MLPLPHSLAHLSRMVPPGVIPVAEGRKLYTGPSLDLRRRSVHRRRQRGPLDLRECLTLSSVDFPTWTLAAPWPHFAQRRGYGHYTTLRTSSDKLLFLVLQLCPSGMDDYARCWNILMARSLILALHLLPVPVSLSPTTLDVFHVEGVPKALRGSMSKSLIDAITKSDKLLLLQDRWERN
ncbi:hypothetical protein M422DRAFT_271969 [Sphaerobolus stellatus SS14]|uniref:Uncharacterized protein n=1 Tax=Sphaerobolus stellatus (strain SS14) TaxID=990650 RepID=A0A0C9UCL6_SPHS4|nr:hypothetical protein M422DRAFT_271969 [Sphaerobolus stellatus SS14]